MAKKINFKNLCLRKLSVYKQELKLGNYVIKNNVPIRLINLDELSPFLKFL
jgi:hypothetical protein